MRHFAIVLMCAILMACGDAPLPRLPSDAALRGSRNVGPEPERALPATVFVSGHSLVDVPYPQYLASIAGSLGQPLSWDRQYVVGSTIRQRSPPAMPPGQFDALIITEQHGVLNSLAMDDTRRYLREWHDFHISRNPSGQTWFFMPWLSLDDTANPRRWIAYERAAAHVWQCTVSRINSDLLAAGREDQIRLIPASLALAHLTEVLQQEGGPAIFADNVHLTAAGKFYMAVATLNALSGGLSPEAGTRIVAPYEAVSRDDAEVLVRIASDFKTQSPPGSVLSESGCRQFLSESFIDDYWRYYRDAMLSPGSSALKARWSAWRMKKQTSPLLLGSP